MHFSTYPKVIDQLYPHLTLADKKREKIVRTRLAKFIKYEDTLEVDRSGNRTFKFDHLDFDLTVDLLDGYASWKKGSDVIILKLL